MSRALLTVDDEHGTASVIVDVELSAKERAALDECLPPDLTREQTWQMLALLTRQVADERAYERVCEQRGLLL